jgi:hypothetical protein
MGGGSPHIKHSMKTVNARTRMFKEEYKVEEMTNLGENINKL